MNHLALLPSPRRSTADRTADELRAQILDGRLAAGTTLPAERQLSEALGVSRLTLRAALGQLEGEGLVRSVHGSGTRVLDYRESAGVELVGHLAEQALAQGRLPVRLLADMLELRRMLAVELLGAVAERATAEDLQAAGAQLRRMEGALFDAAAFHREDLGFARALVRASHNLALELMFNTVLRLLEQHPSVAAAFQADPREALVVYTRLLELIATGDGRRVRRVTRRLVRSLDARTLAKVEALTGIGANDDGGRESAREKGNIQ